MIPEEPNGEGTADRRAFPNFGSGYFFKARRLAVKAYETGCLSFHISDCISSCSASASKKR